MFFFFLAVLCVCQNMKKGQLTLNTEQRSVDMLIKLSGGLSHPDQSCNSRCLQRRPSRAVLLAGVPHVSKHCQNRSADNPTL